MKKSVFHSNYNRLLKIGIIDKSGRLPKPCRRSMVPGTMDLVVQRIEQCDRTVELKGIGVSLASCSIIKGKPHNHLEIVICLCSEQKKVEVIKVKQSNPDVYQSIYIGQEEVSLEHKMQLNQFLTNWLKNLASQGHGRFWTYPALSEHAI